MSHKFHDIAFTPTVRDLQASLGSRGHYARFEAQPDRNGLIGPKETAFIAERDSFYMATVGETGWPYMQHRGGPAGFLQVVDETTLAFADFGGNRQYVSTGNLQTNDRIALFLMDYHRRDRLKILGHARVVTMAEDPALVTGLAVEGYAARVERAIVITVAGLEWNCSQHITPRVELSAVAPVVERLRARIAMLEATLNNPAEE